MPAAQTVERPSAGTGIRTPAPLKVGPAVYGVLLATAASLLPWRTDSYFSGSFDQVDISKAGLLLAAFASAFVLAARAPRPRTVPVEPVFTLLAYLAVTVLGALAAGELAASLVIAVRVGLVLATVALLAMRYPATVLLPSLIAVLGTLFLVAGVTGLGSISTDGRLAGGFPPMHPNELALQGAIVMLWVVSRITHGLDTWGHLLVGTLALGAVLQSGSRTSLLVLVPAVLIVIATATAIRVRTGLLAGALTPLLVWVVMGTDFLASAVLRGQDASRLTSLSNRTIAWRSAFSPRSTIWETLFGSGLATKQIPVTGQYWNTQLLDSSWVSALVQGGLVGLAICALFIVRTVVRTYRTASRQLLGWELAIVVLLASRGMLESGLFDASTSFLILACVALCNGTLMVRGRRPGPDAGG